jgi:hypothetical protein
MPDLVTSPAEPLGAFGAYVYGRFEDRDGSTPAAIGRWLAAHPGNPSLKRSLSPAQVAELLLDTRPQDLAEAEAEWRERRGWVYESFDCSCAHRGWVDVVLDHFRYEGVKQPVVVALAGDADEDPEIRVADWSRGPRTALVTTNDSLDVAADYKIVHGEGHLLGVTVWHRVESESSFETPGEGDESESLL